MQKDYKTKDMGAAPSDKGAGSPPSSKSNEEEYHFSGGGEYKPITIRASSPAEAEEKWKKERTKVEQTTTPPKSEE